MNTATVYSERLGPISDAQFAEACARLQLGTFVRAESTTSGLFGQNVFVTTTNGEYVLRGAPHWVKALGESEYRPQDLWQFTKESFFARLLHERTEAPVAWPYMLEKSTDIFGWPFVIMAKMPGHCFEGPAALKALSEQDRLAVAEALGGTLAAAQQLTWEAPGDLGLDSMEFQAYPAGFLERVVAETREMAEECIRIGTLSPADSEWVEDCAQAALRNPVSREAVFVHGDYKLNNMTVQADAGGTWRVTGIFDLHEARFGDGDLDVVRQTCLYLDSDPAMAPAFVESYRVHAPDHIRLPGNVPYYVISDRMRFWSYFTRPGTRATGTEGRTFQGWAEPYIERIAALLD